MDQFVDENIYEINSDRTPEYLEIVSNIFLSYFIHFKWVESLLVMFSQISGEYIFTCLVHF